MVQERAGHVRVRLRPRATPLPSVTSVLAERIRARLVGAAGVSVELVPAIDPGLDGKFRVARSLVRSAYDSVDLHLV